LAIDTVDFEPAYNLLIHLILITATTQELLPQVISNLATPLSFPQGPSISIAVLSTIFNVIPEYPAIQFQVFRTILSISQEHNLYDYVSPYFKSVNQWLKEWNMTDEQRTQVWATIIPMAEKAEDRFVLITFSRLTPVNYTTSCYPHYLSHRILTPLISS
jgi:translation initiation factor 3 subunit M